MNRAKVIAVAGARPQFIKAAAVSRALAEEPTLDEVFIHTGQHFDPEMSGDFFRELGIPEPAYNLGIHGGGHGAMTGRMMEALEPIFQVQQPSAVVVYGDTNSTLAGALTACKMHIPVAHVEAGLRSFNRRMPEEINRVLSDHASTLLYCPTTTAVANLSREGITEGVKLVGDVMYDATLRARNRARDESSILAQLDLVDQSYAVATIHRAENTSDPALLSTMIEYLRDNAKHQPIVFPVHPRTRNAINRSRLSLDGLSDHSPMQLP